MRPNKYQCGGCLRQQRDEPRVKYCMHCHTEYRRIGSLVELVLQHSPALRGVLRSDLFCRLWIGYLTLSNRKGANDAHLEAAKRLLAAPRAGEQPYEIQPELF